MTLLIILLVILLIMSAPLYPYNRNWGYGWYPSIGFIFLIILIILLVR